MASARDATVRQMRRQTRGDASGKTRARWFLESTGGAALITVLIGGLFGQWITTVVQRGATEREFNNTWLRARGDQALSAYKDYVTEQTRVIEQIYNSVGAMISASESLVAAEYWDFSKPKTREDARAVAIKFNEAENEWVRSQRRFGFLLSYYNNSDQKVLSQWRTLSSAVDTYRECVSGWRESYDGKRRSAPEAICSVQRRAIDHSLDGLGGTLEATRTYLWKGWEKPSDLRKTLRIKE